MAPKDNLNGTECFSFSLPRAFVGLALWLMRGDRYRPDIAYQVGSLSRVTHCFNDTHIAAAKHLLRYLRTTKDYQLVYTSATPMLVADSLKCGLRR
jgi:hypothetical protein